MTNAENYAEYIAVLCGKKERLESERNKTTEINKLIILDYQIEQTQKTIDHINELWENETNKKVVEE